MVVQSVLGHFSAAMTMDVYGHLIAANLWEPATRVGGTTGPRDTKTWMQSAGGEAEGGE